MVKKKTKKKKKRINSRTKGHSYERKMAKVLSKWSNIEIVRTPGSGSYDKRGDLAPRQPEDKIKWVFNFEMKNSEQWNFSDLIKGTNDNTGNYGILDYWRQCTRDAKISQKIPVLVFTKNHEPSYCILYSEHFKLFKLYWECKNYFRYRNLRIFLFDDFLSLKYKKIIKILKK